MEAQKIPPREELVSTLRQALASLLQHQPVSLAYLYGSAATGLVTPFSDVDIGLVVSKTLTPRDRLKLILRLQVDLTDCCDIPNADVRILNDTPLVFRGRVLSDGILLYARTEHERVEFETTTRAEYFDYLPIHQRLQDAFLADVRERGLYSITPQDLRDPRECCRHCERPTGAKQSPTPPKEIASAQKPRLAMTPTWLRPEAALGLTETKSRGSFATCSSTPGIYGSWPNWACQNS